MCCEGVDSMGPLCTASVQHHWETARQFLKLLNIHLSYDLASLFLEIYSRKTETDST